jgi:phosphoglycerate dehydrogenase-like enzyme
MVINTARGGLIAEDAMFDALETGQVAGLGLDVFDQEPPREWRLALHPRVIASPHIGGYTPESIDHALSGAVHHLINALS